MKAAWELIAIPANPKTTAAWGLSIRIFIDFIGLILSKLVWFFSLWVSAFLCLSESNKTRFQFKDFDLWISAIGLLNTLAGFDAFRRFSRENRFLNVTR